MLVLLLLAPTLLFALYSSPDNKYILYTILLSVLSFLLTSFLIPIFAKYTHKRGIFGRDLGKKGTPAGDIEMFVVISFAYPHKISFYYSL